MVKNYECKNFTKVKRKICGSSRDKLIKMDDDQAPKVGTLGIVIGVDDIGSILVSWDNGSSLNVVYGVDHCKLISKKKEGVS